MSKSGPDEVELRAGQSIIVTVDEAYKNECSAERIFVDYKNLPQVMQPGSLIYIDDGLISIKVVSLGADGLSVVGEVLNSGNISSHKGVNLPGTVVDLPSVSEQDKRDLAVGDELRFTRNNKEIGVNNGTLGKVVEINGETVVLSTKAGHVTLQAGAKSDSHIDYAYAMTVHASQGKTTQDNNLLITSDSGKAMSERAFYVGITRPREDMTIYTDSKPHAMKLIQQVMDKTSPVEELRSGELVNGLRPDDEAGKAGKVSSGGRSTGAEL